MAGAGAGLSMVETIALGHYCLGGGTWEGWQTLPDDERAIFTERAERTPELRVVFRFGIGDDELIRASLYELALMAKWGGGGNVFGDYPLGLPITRPLSLRLDWPS